VLEPATAAEFAAELAAAITAGRTNYLVEHLHPAATERYGERQCRNYVRSQVAGDNANWEIQDSRPEAWDYASDGQTTNIADAWAVTIRQPGADPEMRDLHFGPADGTWRWFTDCGDPA
jgi:hypothetical protein